MPNRREGASEAAQRVKARAQRAKRESHRFEESWFGGFLRFGVGLEGNQEEGQVGTGGNQRVGFLDSASKELSDLASRFEDVQSKLSDEIHSFLLSVPIERGISCQVDPVDGGFRGPKQRKLGGTFLESKSTCSRSKKPQ